MTEHISWHYAFFLNLPIGIGLIALLTLGLEGPARAGRCSQRPIFPASSPGLGPGLA